MRTFIITTFTWITMVVTVRTAFSANTPTIMPQDIALQSFAAERILCFSDRYSTLKNIAEPLDAICIRMQNATISGTSRAPRPDAATTTKGAENGTRDGASIVAAVYTGTAGKIFAANAALAAVAIVMFTLL
ncbi:hypothetical protein MBLNU459_g4522t1 [Dothideomycetes sp. NU459]